MPKISFAVIALFITILLFSTIEVVSKTIGYNIDPLQINFLRFFGAGLILLPFALLRKNIKKVTPNRRDVFFFLALGIVNVSFSLSFLHISIQYLPASLVAVLFCTNPIFANLFDRLINNSKLFLYQYLALAISTIGLFIIVFNELFYLSGSIPGIIYGLLSAITYGLFIILAKNSAERWGGFRVNSYTFIIGSSLLIPILLFLGIPVFAFDLVFLPQMFYLILIATALAYMLFLYSLSRLPAGTASLVFFLKPPLATFFAYLFLQEAITPHFIAGTSLIVLGIAFYNYRFFKSLLS